MANLNRIILAGKLTRDPELRYAGSGTAVCGFGLAVNSGTRDKEEVLFIDITAFGKQAETASEYLTKGRSVLIEGRLQFRTWEDKEGQKRSKHAVIADRIQFLDRRESGSGEAAAPARNGRPASTEDFAPPLDDDDIPF